MHLGSLATALSAAVLGAIGCSAVVVADNTQTPVLHTEFRSSKFNAGLRYVEDSGICETTPGVHTASGYIDIAHNQSLVSQIETGDCWGVLKALQWFWFFAARENPETAPFTLWFVILHLSSL